MSIHTPTARFDTGRALSEDELFERAPSIFATQAHESRSERFAPIATIDALRALGREGFVPVGARQCVTRDESRQAFTKHLIRLRHKDWQSNPHRYQVGDTICEILLKNANDGTCQYDLMAGLFRICCLNSLVAQTGEVESVKVRHSGDVTGKVIEGTYRVLESATKALAAPETWSQIMLPPPVQQAFAEGARVIRFGDAEGKVDTPITADHLLQARRIEDTRRDLWTTFNRVQENCIKGGLSARRERQLGEIRGRRVTTRQVNGIDQDLRLNKALWLLAEATAKAAV